MIDDNFVERNIFLQMFNDAKTKKNSFARFATEMFRNFLTDRT